jgi:hypothetical protein
MSRRPPHAAPARVIRYAADAALVGPARSDDAREGRGSEGVDMQPFEDALRLAQETVNTGAMRHVRESAAVLRLRLEEIILSAGLAQQKLDHGRRESVAGMLRLMRMLTVAYSFRFDYTSGESYCAMFLRRFGEEARDAMFEGRFDVEVVRTTNFFPVSELDLARGFPRTKEEVSRRPASDAELAAMPDWKQATRAVPHAEGMYDFADVGRARAIEELRRVLPSVDSDAFVKTERTQTVWTKSSWAALHECVEGVREKQIECRRHLHSLEERNFNAQTQVGAGAGAEWKLQEVDSPPDVMAASGSSVAPIRLVEFTEDMTFPQRIDQVERAAADFAWEHRKQLSGSDVGVFKAEMDSLTAAVKTQMLKVLPVFWGTDTSLTGQAAGASFPNAERGFIEVLDAEIRHWNRQSELLFALVTAVRSQQVGDARVRDHEDELRDFCAFISVNDSYHKTEVGPSPAFAATMRTSHNRPLQAPQGTDMLTPIELEAAVSASAASLEAAEGKFHATRTRRLLAENSARETGDEVKYAELQRRYWAGVVGGEFEPHPEGFEGWLREKGYEPTTPYAAIPPAIAD